MIKREDNFVCKMSPWKNIFGNSHSFYGYTDCTQEIRLVEMFRWQYSETPAFRIQKV